MNEVIGGMKVMVKNSIKNKKGIFSICFMSLLMIGLLTYMNINKSEIFEEQNRTEFISLDALILSFESTNNKESLYQNLLLQKSEVSKQQNGLLFNDTEKYKDSSLELSNLRLEARNDPNFLSLTQGLQPKLSETLKNNLYYTYLANSNEEFLFSYESFGSIAILFFVILGITWFPICIFLTGDILEDEYEHSTLMKGQPINFMKRLFNKINNLYFIVLSSIFSALIIGFTVTLILGNPVSDLLNSHVIQLVKFIVMKNWQIVLFNIIYLSILFFFTAILSSFLNLLIRNYYLTIILELLLFSIPILFPLFTSKSPWFISGFLLPTYLFNGTYLSNQPTTLLNPIFGGIYLIFCSIILLFIISSVSKKGLKEIRL